MYKKIIVISFFISMLYPLLAFSQGNEVKQLSPFSSVDIEKKGKVIVTQGDAYSVRTEPADKSDKVRATVTGNTLSIDAPSDATVYVTMKEIEKLSISGWGSIASESPIKSENLKLSIGGSGKIEIKDADVKILTADVSGMGKIAVSGKAETAEMNISGAGKINAGGLKTTNGKANISGIGKCTVDVSDNLDVSISGSGSVDYVNPPKNLSKSISGIGKVRESDEEAADTTTVRLGNKKITISEGDGDSENDEKDNDHDGWMGNWEHNWEHSWEKNFHEKNKKNHGGNKPSWPGIEIGVNGYLDAGGSSSLPPGLDYLDLDYGKSTAFSINFFDARKNFFDRHLFLFTGLGITWNAYKFSNDITLLPNSSTVLASFDSINYTKNKLAATYLTAPAMAEYFFGDHRYKSFHIAAGMMLGYKLASHTKQKYESDIGTVKTKVYDNFNLNPFRASVRVSVGYGRVNIFAERALTTFFEKDKGPILYPFTAGIGISSF